MPEGVEIWEKVVASTIWIPTVGARGETKQRRLAGPAGRTFQIRTIDRELGMDISPKNAFNNGKLKAQKGAPVEVVKEQSDADNTFSEEDLGKILEKKGMPFWHAVEKLNEMNARRLKSLTEEGPGDPPTPPRYDATAAQIKKIEEVVASFRKEGPTSGYADIVSDSPTVLK